MVAPPAIMRLHTTLDARADKPASYRLGGIEGDAAHSFGYHLPPSELTGSDYSMKLPRDVAGARDNPVYASAWDLDFDPADMKAVTGRLLTAARTQDPRMKPVREFCGTLNGTQTYPWDLSTNASEGINTWDPSHLWHVHISFYRDACDDFAALEGVLDVICDVPIETDPLEEIMSWYKDQAAFEAAVANIAKKAAHDAVTAAVNNLAKGPDGKPHMLHTYFLGVPGYAEPPVMASKKESHK